MYRRDVLRLMGNGFGMLALTDSLRAAGQGPLAVKPPHFAARAKRVIFLFMNGGPSQVDTFDPKPALDRHHGKSVYQELAADVSSPQSAGALMPGPSRSARHGRSGQWISEALPNLTRHADDIAVIRSMFNS